MRFHPLLQKWRAHLGVDYAAPTGTPVRTVGDGIVEFAGQQNGYGNVVQVKHNNARSTLYAHLSRIDVTMGQRIEQGQRIGAVGSTGWSTGPHLHFEFRVNGQHQDPLRIAKASEAVAIAPAAKAEALAEVKAEEVAPVAEVEATPEVEAPAVEVAPEAEAAPATEENMLEVPAAEEAPAVESDEKAE